MRIRLGKEACPTYITPISATANVYTTGYFKIWKNSHTNIRGYTDIFLSVGLQLIELGLTIK